MSKKDIHIGRLLAKVLQKSISSTEQKELDSYLSRDEQQALIEKYLDNENFKAVQEKLKTINKTAQWEAVKVKAAAGRKGKRVKKLIFVSAAASLLIFISLFLLLPRYETIPDKAVALNINKDKNPGRNEAVLHLANGKTVSLTGTSLSDNRKIASYVEKNAFYHDNALYSAYHTIVTPIATNFNFVLSDGTKVWLNTESELKFPVEFNDSERVVYLKGEAYFDVSHNAAKPFKVICEDDEIKVLGTSFNVRSYEGERMFTTLVTGKVNISNHGTSVDIQPGMQAVSDKSQITVRKVNVNKFTSWKNGIFYFENDDLTDVLQQISKWYAVDIIYKQPIVNIKIGGQISKDVKLSEALEMLNEISNVRFSLEGNKLHVY